MPGINLKERIEGNIAIDNLERVGYRNGRRSGTGSVSFDGSSLIKEDKDFRD